jgi:hypothetical protein
MNLGRWCRIALGTLAARFLARFGDRRQVWRARAIIKSLRLKVLGRAFALRHAAVDSARDASAARFLVARSLLPVALGVGLIVMCAALNGDGGRLAKSVGIGKVDVGTYVVLLQTIAGTTGVFLALYFTAVSSVAATVYVAVPHDIRTLIVRDRLGNVYVRVVAFTMAVAVALLVVRALSGSTYIVALPTEGLLAIFSIFAFIRLGQRAFYLADPTRLVDTLTTDFAHWLLRSTHGGWRWRDAAFQEYYRAQAATSVSSLASLIDIATGQSHLRGGSVRRLTATTAALVRAYLFQRGRIPTDSRWFGERLEHKQWYLASSTELSMATDTASPLQPKPVPDVHWIERELVGRVLASIGRILSAGDFEDTYSAVEALQQVADALGVVWSVEEGVRLAHALTDAVVPVLLARDQSEPLARPAFVPGVLDLVATFPLSLELGFHRSATQLDLPTLGDRLAANDWTRPAAPYGFGLPRPAVRTLEHLGSGALFEQSATVPAPLRTPGWYARELALNSVAWAFQGQVQALLALLGTWYPDTADQLTAADLHEAAGAVLSRGFEVVWKLDRHVAEWEQIVNEIGRFPTHVDLTRPSWDWIAIRRQVDELRIGVLDRLARSIPRLALVERTEEMPDYLGHAVHRTGEACFEALDSNDSGLFSRLFPDYFLGILAIVDQIRAQAADWQPRTAATWMSEPVLDLLDISGYALIYSELHPESQLWGSCRDVWIRYLTTAEQGQRLSVIAAMHQHLRHVFALTPRSVLRTQWEMALTRSLERLPRQSSPHVFGEGEADHPSRLVRRIARTAGGFRTTLFNASDLFIVRFLQPLPGATGLDFGVTDWVAEAIEDDDSDDNGQGV